MFPVNGSLRMAPLFPRSGPGESGSPTSQVLLRCYDFPSRIAGHLFASLPGSARSSSLRVSQLALPVGRRGPSGPGSLFNRRPDLPVCSHADVSGISQVSRQSIPCLCPALATPADPTIPRLLDGFVDAVPALPTAKTSAVNEFRGSVTRLWHPLPTLQESCCHHPCKARFRLAGLAFTGRASNPLDRCKRFQVVHPPFLDLAWRKGSFIFNLPHDSRVKRRSSLRPRCQKPAA